MSNLKFWNVLLNAARILRERGFLYTAKYIPKWIIARLEDREMASFDRQYGTQTVGSIEWKHLKSCEEINVDACFGYRGANK